MDFLPNGRWCRLERYHNTLGIDHSKPLKNLYGETLKPCKLRENDQQGSWDSDGLCSELGGGVVTADSMSDLMGDVIAIVYWSPLVDRMSTQRQSLTIPEMSRTQIGLTMWGNARLPDQVA